MGTHSDCSICTDTATDENPICVCTDCSINVHVLCYGIENIQDWKCTPCMCGIAEPQCKLCLQKNGAFKKTSCGSYVHVICALFTEGVFFEDTIAMEPVNISEVSKAMRNKDCSFCKKADGFCPHCSKYNCKDRIHITCAQKNGCLKEEKKSDGSLKFRAYCQNHKPGKTDRRISSVFVHDKKMKQNREAVKAAKNKRKCETENSASLNSNWITGETPTKKLKSVDANVDQYNYSLQLFNEKTHSNVTARKKNEKKKDTQQPHNNSENIKSIRSATSESLQKSVPSDSLWWDSLQFNISAEKENIPIPLTENHLCYKDEKIANVSIRFRFFTLYHFEMHYTTANFSYNKNV